ncbi:MAG: hypothetical protein AAF958_05755 [Planctomycetota bacterium]
MISCLATGAVFVSGPGYRQSAQRFYFLVLLLVMGFTAVTVMGCRECWLIHTTTLGIMVVAAFCVPTATQFPENPIDHEFDNARGFDDP